MNNRIEKSQEMTFWEHLDVLRAVIIKVMVAFVLLTALCFCFKETLFKVIMAPSSPDFCLFRWLGIGILEVAPTSSAIINTELAGQLMVHFKMALSAGVVLAVPYAVWAFGDFIAPALHKNEKKAMVGAMLGGTALFYSGLAICYLVVFPLAYRFLIDYTVGDNVSNLITLTSYTDTLLTLALLMGLLFELPIVALTLAKVGIVNAELMSNYRKHAIVSIVALAAIVTPTTDLISLALVSAPIYGLYEASILIVRRVHRLKT